MQYDRIKIIFLDDDKCILAGLRRLLHRFRDQWQMCFCQSAEEALVEMESQPVDVVVSDIRMPVIDGAELLRRTRDLYPDTVRFVLSGQAEKEKVLELTDVAHQYFAKPCKPQRLYEAITNIANRRRQLDDQVASTLTGLPSVPFDAESHRKISDLLKNGITDLNQVIRMVRADVGMSLKVLQMTHSSFFGNPRTDLNVDQSCRVLGADLLKAIIVDGEPANHAQYLDCCEQPTTVEVLDYLHALWGIHPIADCQQQISNAPDRMPKESQTTFSS